MKTFLLILVTIALLFGLIGGLSIYNIIPKTKDLVLYGIISCSFLIGFLVGVRLCHEEEKLNNVY